MFRTVALSAAALLLLANSAHAWGSKPQPPKQHVNAGVGNGAEGGRTEKRDLDPGNSGAHNKAGKNFAKPNSPRSGN